MSVCTEGLISVNDPYRDLDYRGLVALFKDIREALEEAAKGVPTVTVRLTSVDTLWQFNFKDGKEDRMLSFHFNISDAAEEVCPGYKLVFSLNAWGNASALIHAVGRALAKWSESETPGYWFRENDCRGAWEFVPVQAIRRS